MYKYSKLYPKVKTVSDDVTDLVDFINDIKPYHTKLDEVIVQYTFVENMMVAVSEDHQKVIDFIIDYNIDESGYDVKRFDHASYDGELISVTEYYPKGFNEYGFDNEHFDAIPKLDIIVNDSPTTIKSSIREHLVIDISRSNIEGLDYKPFDEDLYDTVDLSSLPEIKSYGHPRYFGDVEFDHNAPEWSGYDTSTFSNILTIVIPTIKEPTLSEFDINTFENFVTSNNSKTLTLVDPIIAEFDTTFLENLF